MRALGGVRLSLLAMLAVFGIIQLVPYQVSHPPVVHEPRWDSPRTRSLAVAACYDCHSNQGTVPWYGHVAPVSWLVADDVSSGRKALNFSDWRGGGESSREARQAVADGSMPPSNYYWFGLHATAKLTSTERAELARGLQATLAASR